MTVALVGIAAALGAVLRYLLDRMVASRHNTPFPYGTVIINVTGSFVLGLLTGLGVHHGLSTEAITVIGTGLLGGYTTFSTWAWETVVLVGDRLGFAAVMNVVASIGLGVLAAAAGLALAAA